MALFTATSSLTLPSSNNDFSDWLDAGVRLSILDNVGFISLTGRIYDDALRVTWVNDSNYRAQWLGTGLVFDPNTGSLTDGTITGFVEETFVGGVWVQQWASEGYSIDAVTLSNVARSASTADDDQLVATVLSGADTFHLSSEADSAYGYAGSDSMFGNGGNDTLYGGAGDDSLDGGAGSDELLGSSGNDTLLGGFGSDTLDGGGGADSISGDAGDDTVIARAGSATLAGGTQWDTLTYELARAAVSVNLATGLVTGAFGSQRVSGFEVLIGSPFDDRLIGDTAVTEFHPGAGNDSVDGGGMLSDPQGAGVEAVVYINAPSAVVVDLGLGKATGGSGNDTLVRINGVFGSNFDDTLRGGSGDEAFAGAGGNDSIDGGAGLDIIAAGFHGATSINLSTRTMSGADGSDSFIRIEGAFGGDFNDTLIGSLGNDSLDGGDGSDTLLGLAGNDTLLGGEGDDRLDGGPGIDTVSYAGSYDAVKANLATTALQNTAGGWVDSLAGFENLVGGSYDDQLIGNASSNRLDGGPGADTLSGGAGNDTLYGGNGSDSLVGPPAGPATHWPT